MENVLYGLLLMHVFLDDIVMLGKKNDAPLDYTEKVEGRILRYKLYLKSTKSDFSGYTPTRLRIW